MGGKTHKSDQRCPKFAYLLDAALCRAIRSRCDSPDASPSDIEDATGSKNKIKNKKGELSYDEYHAAWTMGTGDSQAYHVNVGGSPKQFQVTPLECLTMP